MATLKDVAKEAGVSPATVSYVLRNGQYVSPATHDKVMAAARKIGYTTNMQARSLRNGRTGIIEIGVHELDMPYFYSRFATVVAAEIERRGFQALVMQTGVDGQNVMQTVGKIKRQMCDGMILHAAQIASTELQKVAPPRPVVLFDDFSSSQLYDTVVAPNEQEGVAAARHLVDVGCRRIGLVGFSPDALASGVEGTELQRLRGVTSVLSEHGMEVTDASYVPCSWVVDAGRDAAREVIARGMPYDGIICVNDGVALGLIRGFADIGVRVPDAAKVIGFDGISVGEYTVPSISTAGLDFEDLARKAVSMLVERIEGAYDGPPRRIEAGFRLAARESTGVRV